MAALNNTLLLRAVYGVFAVACILSRSSYRENNSPLPTFAGTIISTSPAPVTSNINSPERRLFRSLNL